MSIRKMGKACLLLKWGAGKLVAPLSIDPQWEKYLVLSLQFRHGCVSTQPFEAMLVKIIIQGHCFYHHHHN